MIINGTELFEKDCTYPMWVDISMFNGNGDLKPDAYQRIFASCAERHLTRFQADTERLLPFSLAWAMTSISIEIVNPITKCQVVHIRTWHSIRKGPYFRREFLCCNDEGETLFRGTCFTIVLDVSSRKVFRKKELPIPIDAPHPETILDAAPTYKTDLEFADVAQRVVYAGDLDRLGHCNNTRYSDFAYSVLPAHETDNIGALKRIDIFFQSEMRQGDCFTLQRAEQDGQIVIRGKNNTKEDIAFHCIFTF